MRLLSLVLSLLLMSIAIEAKTLFFEARDNKICPDGKESCPDGTTCCQISGDKYGCCPYPDAVCCTDHVHCCPSGYTCDIPDQKCARNNGESIEWSKKLEAVAPLRKDSNSVICPDQQSHCEDGQTCCQLVSGQWGCCPYPEAVCCSDHAHCCPNGYSCDVAAQQCVKQNGESVPWSRKTKALQISGLKSNDITCPDESHCDDGQTCCELESGSYGCCPYPQAVCCSDKEHCCPNGYTCDVPHQQCLKGNGESISWSPKMKTNQKSNDITCPDESHCDDGQTCCELESGSYGCCPYPQAECCSDKEHCCPNGYTCDVPHQQCVQRGNGDIHVWSSHTKASPVSKNSDVVVCPDGSSMCPDGQTCCQLASGIWACCPMPQAVCCSDHAHCCPHGTTCDLVHQQCVQGNGESTPWSTKTKANPIDGLEIREKKEDQRENIVCPDGSSCGDEETCCLISPSQYGCCPMPRATCCTDYVHCCPEDYSCDLQKQTCIKGNGVEIPWTRKTPSKSRRPVESGVCADQKSKCRDGQTCCSQSGTEVHGCCPYENAICCSDGVHCCPENTVCDAKAMMCRSTLNSMAISWHMLEKLIGARAGFRSVKTSVKCPDHKSECPSETTCCQMQSGLYGCCHFKDALCCEDKLHCCPLGFKCDTEHSRCVVEKSGIALPWEMFGRKRAKITL